MNGDRVKVLYVIGKGRSGGTLLNNLLGQIKGFVSPGEIPHLWTWGLEEGALCGCGRAVPECPFWIEVIDFALASPPDQDFVKEMAAWQSRIMRWPSVPRMLVQSTTRRPRWKILRDYVERMGAIYKGLAHTARARVIVENTRWIASPTALGLTPGVDTYVLHLVRDPRAVIYSWRRRGKLWIDRPGSPEMQHFGPFFSVASWWIRNFVAQVVGLRRGPEKYLRYRYEDVIAHPKDSLREICGWLGEPSPDLSFISGDSATIATTHSVGGNPTRPRTGEIVISLDDEWVTRQPIWDRVVGTVFSMPFLQLYRYPVLPRQPA
jgi:sulfotransferase family protein